MQYEGQIIGVRFKTHGTVYSICKKIVKDDFIARAVGKRFSSNIEKHLEQRFIEHEIVIVDEDDRHVTIVDWDHPDDNIYQYTQE